MEKTDCIVEVMERLQLNTEASPDEPERWKKRSIFKIPVHVVNPNKDAYTPRMAAIGPYHHGLEHLRQMEEHKYRALHHFLCRSVKPLQSYNKALAEVVHDLKDAYGHLDQAWKQDIGKFLQLMITDGCFILETLWADQSEEDEYPSDVVFSSHGQRSAIPYIKRNMLLLENQVPLLVLQKLLAVNQSVHSIETQQSENQVIELILECYKRTKSTSLGRCLHILDVYRKSMIIVGGYYYEPASASRRPPKELRSAVHSISATKLKESGIKITKSGLNSLLDIKFHGRTLRLPRISLDDTSESAFLNVVAFERLHIASIN